MSDFVQKTSIEGLLILKRPIHKDARGFFREVFHINEIEETLNIEFKGVQMNHAFSKPKVLRGIHAENWNKIICPVNGEVFIAIVDIRLDSSTFTKVETFTINDQNRIALFVSKGLANSYCVTSEGSVDYIYLVDAYYDWTDTRAIAWDDPDLKINWPVKNPIISERDRNNPKLRELFPGKFP
ncbi:dTDP-4-dehydrorhamnose 3,5-epimerase family protein [Candidatus Daviesbacteria bacterium]|nr:dTDP-4-dehydrorhamnose 3,5-epimerase family protein [Candidatus Daviesbacteria bacterium]